MYLIEIISPTEEELVERFIVWGRWQEFCQRYPRTMQRDILRGLYIGGLPAKSWKAWLTTFLMNVPLPATGFPFLPTKIPPHFFQDVLAHIRTCIKRYEITPVEPPLYPAALTAAYGYTQAAYLEDLRRYAGIVDVSRYQVAPWPEEGMRPEDRDTVVVVTPSRQFIDEAWWDNGFVDSFRSLFRAVERWIV